MVNVGDKVHVSYEATVTKVEDRPNGIRVETAGGWDTFNPSDEGKLFTVTERAPEPDYPVGTVIRNGDAAVYVKGTKEWIATYTNQGETAYGEFHHGHWDRVMRNRVETEGAEVLYIPA